MRQYIACKQKDLEALTNTRFSTIKERFSCFVEYIDKNEKVFDVGINTLVR